MEIIDILKAPQRGIRKLYDWTIHWSKTSKAPYALFVIAFCESSFFPVPPDVLLIPMVVADIKKWWRHALVCTLGSITGAFFGYLIGWGLYEAVGKPIVDFYNLQEQMNYVGTQFSENAFLFIFGAAFTPIPYKLITISAGLFSLPLYTLVIASLVGRAGRFFLVAGALRIFGKKLSASIEKYFDIFSLIFLLLLVGGFLAVKYLF
ncbi:MAG: SNARE associated Golgi protein [candidate division WS2 bacterium ADurb.Bin280]|uniref:SNARE associated Golgi protein n=1 Tax=candidate division WS2 bacterium ADurb.Bin280 TaxID=1852829 RepID=A0A1V5SED6_9BACT|nr:MAG: SNARE associated Golgi protein [candidate division WS2 bacterium ADurb.Bin280]